MAVFSGPEIPNNGLVLCIDASNQKCYPGTGTAVTDISTSKTAFTILDSAGYSSTDSVFRFNYQANGTASNWITSNTFTGIASGNVNNFSYCGFAKVTNASTVRCWTFDDFDQDTTNRINFYVFNDRPSIEINNIIANVPTLPSFPTTNAWAFFAFTVENSGLTYNLYRWNTTTLSLEANTAVVASAGTIGTQIIFGRRGAPTNNQCGLDLGVQLMFNRTLTVTEILQTFASYRGRYNL